MSEPKPDLRYEWEPVKGALVPKQKRPAGFIRAVPKDERGS